MVKTNLVGYHDTVMNLSNATDITTKANLQYICKELISSQLRIFFTLSFAREGLLVNPSRITGTHLLRYITTLCDLDKTSRQVHRHVSFAIREHLIR